MRRRKRHIQGDVELNMAAMLDMAFQLLAFFILTYRPAPVEGCIALRMPPPAPITSPDSWKDAGAPSPGDANALAGILSLQIKVTAGERGSIAAIRVAGHPPVSSLADFEQKLQMLMKTSNIPFEQVLLHVSPSLEYQNVLKVVEICARNKLTPRDKQTKLSITEMPERAELQEMKTALQKN
jgi:biopolymer transport protein ExbD